jgi:hypothetical protein
VDSALGSSPAISTEFSGDFLTDSLATVLLMLSGMLHGLVAGSLIVMVDLLILGRIYRRNFFAFLIDRLRHADEEKAPELPFTAPLILTGLGTIAGFLAVTPFVTWTNPGIVGGSSAAFALVALMYSSWTLPALVDGERKQRERGRGIMGRTGL